jgi:hypothetical protein
MEDIMRTLHAIVGLVVVAWTFISVSAPAATQTSPAESPKAGPPVSLAPAEIRRFARGAPVGSVLGLSLGMPEERVHRELARLGHPASDAVKEEDEERGNEGLMRELWMLDDPRYASILVVFDESRTLRAFQAYLRPGRRGIRYREIGDLSHAQRLGYTIWQWEVGPENGRPGRRVVARGVDSLYAGSVAMTRLP